MRKIRLFIYLLVVVFLFTGCRLISTPSTSGTIVPTLPISLGQPTNTVSATEVELALPTPTLKPQPTRTSTPFVPLQGTINVQNLKLHSGPGFLFDTVGLYDENSIVSVYGRELGGGWYFVSTPDSRSGWMKAEYITFIDDIEKLPFFGFSDGNLIYGHVRNSAGEPMTNISIVIWPSNSQDAANQDNTVTDDTGTYYLYLPKTLSGYFTIGENGYDCKSNAVNSECAFLYGNPSAQSIEIPHPSDISIEFVLPPLP